MALFVEIIKKEFNASVDIKVREIEGRQLNIPFEKEYLKWIKQQGRDNQVKMLQADGSEKDYILSQFENLPTTKGNMCIWIGDLANLIAANLQ